jgi:hypothetical protein
MNVKSTIRQCIAAVLLLIFALGATPKKFIHDVVTNHHHQHNTKASCQHHHINIGTAGFNCQIDSLVVEMPFIAALQPVFNFVTTQYFQYNLPSYNKLISTNVYVAYLRGPPAC